MEKSGSSNYVLNTSYLQVNQPENAVQHGVQMRTYQFRVVLTGVSTSKVSELVGLTSLTVTLKTKYCLAVLLLFVTFMVKNLILFIKQLLTLLFFFAVKFILRKDYRQF